MTLRTLLGPVLAGLAIILALGATARADSCDALTVRLIRETGASLAGRSGSVVVFRAIDADRMSLDCAASPRLLFRSALREPHRSFFLLIGLAARTLSGASPDAIEALALRLHQETLLTGEPQLGRAGGTVLRCDPGDRPDGISAGSLCRIARDKRPRAPRLPRTAGPG